MELAGDSGYCFDCGTDRASRAAAPLSSRGHLPDTDDDFPVRASHFFWLDSLLLTEWWYLPASLLMMALVPLLLLSGILPWDYLSGLLAISVICILALLLAWKMR